MDADFSNSDDFINSQNCIQSLEYPQVNTNKQMNIQLVAIWCQYWSGDFTGPVFGKLFSPDSVVSSRQ